ncbi:hypothetical protein RhiirC2_722327 [Rhizophagus irregularis]|uniref:Uncharacterized protein n=1 Tax=Rhizophagus irregularis TaxID=588596 RepID=A0A2N1M1Y3_9GLOM|nr:hypothetical protein RhiirC2_722327 [Rhizophagus irregularis]
MRKLAEQKANSFCYLVHWIDTNTTWGPFLYRGENATQEFVRRIDQELVAINEVLTVKHDRIETEEDKKNFAESDTCWICNGKFAVDREAVDCLEKKIWVINEKLKNSAKDGNSDEHKSLVTLILKTTKEIKNLESMDDKVWDHCHMTGKYRGSAHNSCNLKLRIEAWKTPIPVIFHNFRGYDSHLVCESVGRSVNAYQIRVVAETFERYKTMKEVFHAKNVSIRSKDHILSLVESVKKALCPIDTKRWILSDGITTLPYRHWCNMIYKNMVKDGIPHEEAEKRAIRAKLPEKYQNECTSHITSSQQ